MPIAYARSDTTIVASCAVSTRFGIYALSSLKYGLSLWGCWRNASTAGWTTNGGRSIAGLILQIAVVFLSSLHTASCPYGDLKYCFTCITKAQASELKCGPRHGSPQNDCYLPQISKSCCAWLEEVFCLIRYNNKLSVSVIFLGVVLISQPPCLPLGFSSMS